jgi:hypothetical protein
MGELEMQTAFTDEALANMALIKLGLKPSVTSIKGISNTEKLFAEILPRIIPLAIRKYRPNCCVSRAILAQDPTYTPRWEFASGYKYPANMVKLLEVDNKTLLPDENPIEGQWILSHAPKPVEIGDPVCTMPVKYLEYKTTNLFDADFFNLCALEIAAEAAPGLDKTREAFIIALRDKEADRWASDNAMENGFTVEQYDPLFDVVHTVRS